MEKQRDTNIGNIKQQSDLYTWLDKNYRIAPLLYLINDGE